MICPTCKAELPDDDDRFCAYCGVPIPAPSPTVEPEPKPAPEPEASRTVVRPEPVAPVEVPVPEPQPDDPTRRAAGSGRSPLTAAAVVTSIMALVAVIGLALVVTRPFDQPATGGGEIVVTPPSDTTPPDEVTPPEGVGSDGESGGGVVDIDTIIDAYDNGGTGSGTGDEPDLDTGDKVPNGTYVLADSDSHRYTTEELDELSDWELYLARNEIYARHGREFRNDDLTRYFEGQPWYEPTYSPDDFDTHQDTILSEVERDNAQTILALEQARGSEYV